MFWNVCFYSDTLTLSQIDGFSGRAEINNKMLLKCLRITPLWGKDCKGILLSTFCFLTVLILHMTATMWLWPLSFQFPIFNTAVSLRGREKHFTNVCIVLAIQNDSHIACSCKTTNQEECHLIIILRYLTFSNSSWPHIKLGLSQTQLSSTCQWSIRNFSQNHLHFLHKSSSLIQPRKLLAHC